ncbi:tyrosine-type recombinase/integrase [Mycolicibacterium mengxianglii]|uniref:tyrosine-type recombinase/integrase n=1 Tax=Mycolicibacterium mengxianglii TaxID=2736649 RepID=UPI0018EF03AE|nr:site-specific integrase [Mycolicibacterium mengxianglii]
MAIQARVEDRWHRPARKGENVPYPADNPVGSWCMEPKHGPTAALVTTARHGQGRRWLARWVDAEGQERSRAFDRKAEAQTLVRKMTTDIVSGTYVDARRSAVSLGTVAEEWFATVKPKLKPSTVGGYRSVLDMRVLPKWQDVKLADITHADVQAWVTWMSSNPESRQLRTTDPERRTVKPAPLSASSTIHAHRVLKQILAYAVRTKRLAANPSEGITLPRLVHRPDTALTHEQIRALVAAAGDAGPVLLALAYTGCRFGELAALRVGDVDVSRRRITISKAVAQVAGVGLVEDTTKTHQVRTVPILTTGLAEVLTKVTAGRDAAEYLFPGTNGEPMRNGYLRWRYDQACKSIGLTGVSIKTLRHSAGSLALASGASVVTAQRLLGHKDPTTTLRVYSHMLPDDFDNLAEAMDKASKVAP